MFNSARISKLEALVHGLDEDLDELDQEIEGLAGLAHRVEECEVNQEAHRLAGLATAEAAILQNDLILFLYDRIRKLEADVAGIKFDVSNNRAAYTGVGADTSSLRGSYAGGTVILD